MTKLYGLLLIIFAVARTGYGQIETSCLTPAHVPLDSLVRYVAARVDSPAPRVRRNPLNLTAKEITAKWNSKLDTLLFNCEDYLIDKLGKDLYLSNTELSGIAFRYPKFTYLYFVFYLPGSQSKARDGGGNLLIYETIPFRFSITMGQDSSYAITSYPDIPDCKNTPDCGFISKDSAIAIATRMGFLGKYDNYDMRLDSKKTYWLITSRSEIKNHWDKAEIDFKTGEFIDMTECHVPIHVTADSLFKFANSNSDIKVVYDWTKVDSSKVSNYVKEHDYGGSWNKRLDTAFAKCQDFLIQKLGRDIYCRHMVLPLHDFNYWPKIRECQQEKLPDDYLSNLPDLARQALAFDLILPDFKHKVPVGNSTAIETERIKFKFMIKLKVDSSVVIIYPDNVPDCNSLSDCGFITREHAVEIAKENGFINSEDDFRVMLDSGGNGYGGNSPFWKIEKTITKNSLWDNASIDLKTGEFKSIGKSMRID